MSLTTPFPPFHFPLPLSFASSSSRMPKEWIKTGYRRSRISTSPIRVLVICVWTPETPWKLGPAPEPPAMVYKEFM